VIADGAKTRAERADRTPDYILILLDHIRYMHDSRHALKSAMYTRAEVCLFDSGCDRCCKAATWWPPAVPHADRSAGGERPAVGSGAWCFALANV
jgi:hypothetical protein